MNWLHHKTAKGNHSFLGHRVIYVPPRLDNPRIIGVSLTPHSPHLIIWPLR